MIRTPVKRDGRQGNETEERIGGNEEGETIECDMKTEKEGAGADEVLGEAESLVNLNLVRSDSLQSLPDLSSFVDRKKVGRRSRKELELKERRVNDKWWAAMLQNKVRERKSLVKEDREGDEEKEEEEGVKKKESEKVGGELEEFMRVMMKIGEETNVRMERLSKELKENNDQGRLRDGKMEEIRGEIGGIRNMWEEWERVWKREKGEMLEKLEVLELDQEKMVKEGKEERRKLEIRVERLEEREMSDAGGNGCKRKSGEGLEEKVKELTRKVDQMEREKRKSGIAIRGMRVKKDEGRKEIEKLLKDIGVKVNIRSIKGIDGEEKETPKIWIVQLGCEEERREVMANKYKLKGRKERIEEDKSWGERRNEWLLRERAWEEMRKGRKVQIGRDCIWVEGSRWTVEDITAGVERKRGGGFGERAENTKEGEKEEVVE
ncbi:golgin subfamily A member 6-like protein 2 [Leptopilina boulardi]|uniref:golgin subfamily A member 6-like protein 2 n=1 Tax=Leptopilina boulardi TaxID=63433 RepID=UPI0021F5B21E|nr:golgin subfamily A member 6-like protein 2 [Leptopilina boulardi]